jgi:hypothetical protein
MPPAITLPSWQHFGSNTGAVIRELLTKEAFHEAVRKDGPIVILDKTNGARYHPSASCAHVTIDGFVEKVIVNRRKNGGYFSVESRAEAEQRWPSLADCWGWT